MNCRLDSAAYEAIEYCIDKDFAKDLSFSQTESNTEFNKRRVSGVVTQRKVRNERPSGTTYTFLPQTNFGTRHFEKRLNTGPMTVGQILQAFCGPIRMTPDLDLEAFAQIRQMCNSQIYAVTFNVTKNEELIEVEDGVDFIESPGFQTNERLRSKVKFQKLFTGRPICWRTSVGLTWIWDVPPPCLGSR